MYEKKLLFCLCLGVSLFFVSCQSDYDKMVARETARGIRCDTLFWNLSLNMPGDSFFVNCKTLNSQKIVTQAEGEGKSVVHFLDKPEMQSPAKMFFYPTFSKDNKLSEMPISFQYDNYFPFKTDYNADKLLPDVLQLMEHWYGKGFIKIEKIPNDPVYAKIDGNRRILIRKKDDARVSVIISDLTQKQLK